MGKMCESVINTRFNNQKIGGDLFSELFHYTIYNFILLLYICKMTTLTDIKSILKKHKYLLVEKYGLSFLAIFGSYGRGQQTENSDIDILVDFNRPIGIEFIDLANELEKLLKIKVDLVSKNGVKPQYLKQIEPDLTYV